MQAQTVSVSLEEISKYLKSDSFSDSLLLFDNYDESPDKFTVRETHYPVKLDFGLSFFVWEGYCRIKLGHQEYRLTKNDSISIKEGKIIQHLGSSEDVKIGAICIKHDFFELSADMGKAMDINNIITQHPVQHIPDAMVDEFKSLYLTIKRSIRDKDNICRKQIVKCYFNILFYHACNLLLTTTSDKPELGRKEEVFRKFISEIEIHYRHHRSVKFYSDKLCLSPKYFSTLIHEHTGQHASDWIDNYVILEAKAMLRSSFMTIQQISYELNFATPSHFGKYFKRLTGISPREYRKS